LNARRIIYADTPPSCSLARHTYAKLRNLLLSLSVGGRPPFEPDDRTISGRPREISDSRWTLSPWLSPEISQISVFLRARPTATRAHTDSKGGFQVDGTRGTRFRLASCAITLNVRTRSTCHHHCIVELAVTHCRNTSLSPAALFFRRGNSPGR